MPRIESLTVHMQSVRTRLMIWNICVVALLLAILGGIVQYTTQSALQIAVDNDLTKNTRTFMGQARDFLIRDSHLSLDQRSFPVPGDRGDVRFGPPPGPPPDRVARSPQTIRIMDEQRRESFVPRIFNLSGVAMRPYEKTGPWDPNALQRAFRNQPISSTVIVDGEPVRVLSTPVQWRGRILGAVQVAHPLADIRQASASVTQTLLALIPVGLLFAGFAGAAVTSRALKPVGQIATTADQIDEHDLTQRLDVVGSDEFSRLATTFNRMVSRLDGAFARQRSLVAQLEHLLEEQKRFTADASHELKTPLSVIKIHSELLLHGEPSPSEFAESAHSIKDSADRMTALVQDLLLLARSDAGELNRPRTALSVRDLLEQARRLNRGLDAPKVRLEQADMDLAVLGSEDELVRVFSNLINNAIRHTPADGTVCLTVTAHDAQVVVRVADTGEGIAPEHLPHLGERFYRVDSARSRGQGGAGLGLSICKSLVEHHHGTLTFESAPGKGTTVMVTLPVDRS